MKRNRISLTVALIALAFVLLGFFAVNITSAPIWLLFRRVAGLELARTIAQIAAWLATIALVIAGAVIAIPTALVETTRLRKLLYVVPVFLLGLTIATGLANGWGIATAGSVFGGPGPAGISLAVAGLGINALLATIALAIAIAFANLNERILKIATMSTGAALIPSLILCLAMLYSINLVVANQSSLPVGGGNPPVPLGGDTSGGPGGLGGIADLILQIEIGGGAMIVFGIIALVSSVFALRATRSSTIADAPPTPIDYRRQGMQAIVSIVIVSAIVFVAIQLIPVSRTNPPVQSIIQWDSPQTKDLVYRACMNCHSNETEWPWYTNLAPASWITSVDVNNARAQFNLSELNKMPTFRRSRLARDMAEQIRNGTMPPSDFLLLHPQARLTDTEKNQLIQGLQNSLK